MDKKYYVDIFFGECPTCQNQIFGKMYFGLFELAEMGAAKHAGLVTYYCVHCDTSYASNKLLVNGEAREVSKEEALSKGLAFDSKGRA